MGEFLTENNVDIAPENQILRLWPRSGEGASNNDEMGKATAMVVIAIGVLLAAVGVLLWRLAVNNRAGRTAWLATRGSIASCGVTLQEVPGENSGTFDRFGAHYTYAIDGTPQRGYIFTDKAKNHKILLTKYSAGTTVEVFYDPAKPARSEIRDPFVQTGGWSAGLDRLGYVLMPMGAITATVGLILAFSE